eukprot:TRINITY_DN8932_c0_g1_i14.p1 TRINITY_DN8932_c0_g1~~TRINITY_DN8932_c0_g1_i14.p1  ORF type:complete len:370 (+),score=98.63 TRINITY_DN8932_c0_g1_i14:239-1348(+)
MSKKDRKFESQKVLHYDIDNNSAASRRQLKGVFLENDKEQVRRYIEDLEKTIKLNKGIITDLLSTNKSSSMHMKAIEKLNTENSTLQAKVKELIRERDEAQARVLVCEQMIAEFSGREKAIEAHYEELAEEIRDQLNVKEYILQLYERRFRKTIKLLQQYEGKDIQAHALLKELVRENDERRAVTNVLDENEELLNKTKELYELIANFDQELHLLAHGSSKKAEKTIRKPPVQRRISSSDTLPMTIRQEMDSIEFYAKALNGLMQSLQTSKGFIEQNVMKLKEENKSMNLLNSRLSQELFETNEELKFLKERRRVNQAVRGPNKHRRMTTQVQKKEVSIDAGIDFGDVSSIIGDYKNNEFSSFYRDLDY